MASNQHPHTQDRARRGEAYGYPAGQCLVRGCTENLHGTPAVICRAHYFEVAQFNLWLAGRGRKVGPGHQAVQDPTDARCSFDVARAEWERLYSDRP